MGGFNRWFGEGERVGLIRVHKWTLKTRFKIMGKINGVQKTERL